MGRKQTKIMEMQPCMVLFHMPVKHINKHSEEEEEEEGRCFLSVLLFNSRNNGRFPFQLIILLVSRPHCTRTGRDNLIVGIFLTACGNPLKRDTTPVNALSMKLV